jgi:riboflavin kinase/FMN adenylyltransferase
MDELTGDDFRAFGRTAVIVGHESVAMTFGNFDGVHRGHRKLLEELKAFSDGLPVVAFTFDPHPSHVLRPGAAKPLLMSLNERVAALLASGADIVYVQKFDSAFASLTADEFCGVFLASRFDIKAAMIGFNFCYGRDRQGCWSHFRPFAERFGWKAAHSSPFLLDGVEVSSSKIRELIQSGQVDEAARYLGRPYMLDGIVVRGNQMGRQIGFPTANLGTDKKILPANGVYSCLVDVDGVGDRLPAVMNCGVRPTLGAGLATQIEAHILDFSQDIYGLSMKFHLLRRLRDEMRFQGLDSLKEQIALDVASAREYFLRNPADHGV